MLPVFLLRGSDTLGARPTRVSQRRAVGGEAVRRERDVVSWVYGEPADVQARPDGRPLRFVWRGRLYTVRAILEHWVINREWWRDPADSESPTDPTDPERPRDPGHPHPGHPELEFWRVEASSGAGITPAVYELRREPATGTWTLRRG